MSTNELYHELILDHSKSPRNKGSLPTSTHEAEGHNVICGDIIKVFLEMEDSLINRVAFDGEGCAICMASASLMTERIKGLTADQALNLFDEFHSLVTTDLANQKLGKLQAFAGVKEYPIRVKCATLPWHTLKSAIGENPSVST